MVKTSIRRNLVVYRDGPLRRFLDPAQLQLYRFSSRSAPTPLQPKYPPLQLQPFAQSLRSDSALTEKNILTLRSEVGAAHLWLFILFLLLVFENLIVFFIFKHSIFEMN